MYIRVVIADDHQLMRAGIAALLIDIPEVEVVGEASNGQEAVDLVAELKPDILFLDLAMPGMSGMEALTIIHEAQPEVKVIILSMNNSEEHVLHALRLGALGFMIKDAAPEELEHAIKAVWRGDTWLSAAVSKTVIASYLERRANDDSFNQLSARQCQVLKMIAEGASTKEISFALNLSIKTIETHRAQIMDKLDIHDIAGLVRYAIRQGLIPL